MARVRGLATRHRCNRAKGTWSFEIIYYLEGKDQQRFRSARKAVIGGLRPTTSGVSQCTEGILRWSSGRHHLL